MADIKKFAEELVNLTVKQVNELATILKDDYGIEPATTQAIVGPVGTSGEGEVKEEKSEFDVVLKSPGTAKLAVVKVVKELTGLGLKDAKALVDGVPSTILESVSKDEAEGIKSQLKEAGAEVELK